MSEIEIEGKTIEEAIEEGLGKLGVSRDKVDVKILNEGATGLFGLMGNKPARVKLIIKGTSASGVDYAQAQEKAKEYIENIIKFMGLSFTKIDTSQTDEGVLVNVKSTDSRFIIGKNGQTLDALEHVLNLMVNKNEETRTRIIFETEGYRKQQEERLNAMADKAIAEVKRTGKPYRFEPMSSKERRIIHISLKNSTDIESFSEGEGAFRKVVIKLKK
ncbi:MAG: protein jag [Elusimicrobia bacterium]|nr:protein jag [Candidatus Liberimonas magnetica]